MIKVLKRITKLTDDELLKDYDDTKRAIGIFQFTDKINDKVLNRVFDLEEELKCRGLMSNEL